MFDNEDFENLPEEIKRIILAMMNPKIAKKYDYKKLGPPTSIEKFTDYGFKFIKKTWKRKDGSIISEIQPDFDDAEEVDYEEVYEKPKVSLEKQLAIAIENENYEEAARLRDKINGTDLDSLLALKVNNTKNKMRAGMKKRNKKNDDIWDI